MRKQDPKGVRQWYVLCIDTDTNDSVRRLIYEEYAHTNKRCADKVHRDLWEVSHVDYRRIMASRVSGGFKLEVYFDTSDGGPILRHHFEKESTSAVEYVRKMLAARAARPAPR
ncbi:MAG: hypothetical protein JWN89_88 [Parcubacteria group bacterium]|nr:hypothetical protein [Parcubacteria group bacterium]